MTTQATEGFETNVFDKLLAKQLLDNGAVSIAIGGVPVDGDWDLAKIDKHAGNNLKIVPNTSDTVKVIHGTIWDGTQAWNSPDTLVGVGQSITMATGNNHLFAVEGTPPAISIQSLNGANPAAPANTIERIGMVQVAPSSGSIREIHTRPVMVNQTFIETATAEFGTYDGFQQSGVTNNVVIFSASFSLAGSNKVGEFALVTGTSLPNSGVIDPSSIIAYSAMTGTQSTYNNVVLNVTWKVILHTPSAFYL